MIDIFCIGTPDVVGDAIGPLVGSMLSHRNILDVNIVGTLEDPVVRSNYTEQTKRLRDGAFVIVVDAIVGRDVGTYTITPEAMIPGEAVKAGIEPIGHVSVKCVTASTVLEMSLADKWTVAMLAYDITTELMKTLPTTHNNKVYIEINK